MKIWIDLANSPQVLFFRPIISELRSRGHHIVITSRDFAQTLALADQHGLEHTPVGQHGGKRWTNIIRRTGGRALELSKWARRESGIEMALSHNSYGQALAAMLLRVPFVTLMDYEHQPFNHVCFRLARRVIVPESFPDEYLGRYGAARKAVKYPGLKEQVYLSDFCPSPGFLQEHDIPAQPILAVMRPPAPWAAYHRFENTLFDDVLSWLARQPDTFIVFLPRIPSQGDAARSLGFPNVWVPPQTLDGPNLLYHADLVISGGGTMNREAAVLGTATYTLFKGELGAVDRYLIERGRMVQVSEPEDLAKIKVQKRAGRANALLDTGLIGKITDQIIGAV